MPDRRVVDFGVSRVTTVRRLPALRLPTETSPPRGDAMAIEAVTTRRRRADEIPSGEPIWERSYQAGWVRLLNAAGAGLRWFGLRPTRLDPEALLAEARRRSGGLSDWGDAGFREGLDVLVRAFEERGNAHTFGRIFFREYCVRRLVNRLKVQDDLKRHPEILDVPIRRPLIITGLPRTGTTLLHRLLSEDPTGRTLLAWEAMEPSPSPEPATCRTDPRIARARKATRTLNALAPGVAAAHLFDAEEPEECNDLFGNGFVAGFLGFLFDVPDYVDWLDHHDLIEPYRNLRRQLQLLSWRLRGDHWILKAPAHLFGLGPLLAAFPDACIVVTHRDPLESLPSVCSLAAALRGITCDRIDLARLGAEMNEAFAVGPERAIAARASADPSRFLDVTYPALVADPVGTARAVCKHFGYACDAEFVRRMHLRLAANPQHKHGIHRYSLAQFGLTTELVNRRFTAYHQWMAVRMNAEARRIDAAHSESR